MEDLLRAHLPQLEASKVPEALWGRLFEKLLTQTFDGGAVFTFAYDEDEAPGSRYYVLVSAEDGLRCGEDIYLVDHSWTFSDLKDAHGQLAAVEGLRERMVALMDIDPIEGTPIDEQIEDGLLQFGSSYCLANGDAGSTSSTYCYVMDELGSRFVADKADPAFNMVPFFFLPTGEAFTIIWPVRDVTSGEMATRQLLPAIDMFDRGKAYWSKRFEVEDSHEWYCGWDVLGPHLTCLIRQSDHVLVYGCGNSNLSPDMAKAGYQNIHSVDYADNVIEAMSKKHGTAGGALAWSVADVTCMAAWEDGRVDCILDKGCLDSMLALNATEGKGWKSVAEGTKDDISMAEQTLKEARRILKPSGLLILITMVGPHNRLPLLDRFFEVESVLQIEEKGASQEFAYYGYVCRTAAAQ